jgi:DNA-binding NtrC family response regulator
MRIPFLGKLLGRDTGDGDGRSLNLAGAITNPSKAGAAGGSSRDQNASNTPSTQRQTEVEKKSQYLFSFVDFKDPFGTGEIAGEELPGPILSIMSARRFDCAFLFHTPHTRANAEATQQEVRSRYPDCGISLIELDLSDPKDYSSLMGVFAKHVRILVRLRRLMDPGVENFVCVSSGTAEMRAAWFLLTSLRVLPATLLQVGSPMQPLFGGANVKEVRMGESEWETIRELAMPVDYFLTHMPESTPRSASLRSQLRRLHGAPSEATPVKAEPENYDFGSRVDPGKADSSASTDSALDEEVTGELAIESLAREVPGLDDALQELGIHVGSAVLRHAAERAGIAAGSDLPVLLCGETGTGKERFAHLIHRMSSRRPQELVAINCAAIPESLAEDYLFGHMKGAFSGANSDKKGMFESADRSTLFLDEIGELTLEVQAKLLRVIQDGVVQRLGSTAPRKVDVRIVAASNRDLRNEVSAGRFREDLYFRLEVVQIKLPALRERRSEIPELAIALLRQINLRRHKPRKLSSAALLRLERYHWPGNVRQLSNVLERSVLYAKAEGLQAEDLLIGEDTPSKDSFTKLPEPAPGFKLEEYLSEVRERLFDKALEACNGNQTEAADRLGVSKQAVSKFVASKTTTRVDAS